MECLDCPLDWDIAITHRINKFLWNCVIKRVDSLLSLLRRGQLNESETFTHFAILKLWNTHMLYATCPLEYGGQLLMGKFLRETFDIDHALINLASVSRIFTKWDPSLKFCLIL